MCLFLHQEPMKVLHVAKAPSIWYMIVVLCDIDKMYIYIIRIVLWDCG